MLSLFNTGYGLQNQLDGVKDGIAIVATGNTHVAITSGQYVYIQDNSTLAEGLYRATTNIAANGTLSGSNVTAVSGGGLNALNSNTTNYYNIGTIAHDTSLENDIKIAMGQAYSHVTNGGNSCCIGGFVTGRGTINCIVTKRDNIMQFIANLEKKTFSGYYVNSSDYYIEELALNSNIFISGTIGSRLAILDTTGDSYTIPATGMYKLAFGGTGGQIKMNGNVLFDNNVVVQFAVPFKQGATLSWVKAGGTCSIYRVE